MSLAFYFLMFSVLGRAEHRVLEHPIRTDSGTERPAGEPSTGCQFELDSLEPGDVEDKEILETLIRFINDSGRQYLGSAEKAGDLLVQAAKEGAAEKITEAMLSHFDSTDGMEHGQFFATLGEVAQNLSVGSPLANRAKTVLRKALARLSEQQVQNALRNNWPEKALFVETGASAASGLEAMAAHIRPDEILALAENPLPESASALKKVLELNLIEKADRQFAFELDRAHFGKLSGGPDERGYRARVIERFFGNLGKIPVQDSDLLFETFERMSEFAQAHDLFNTMRDRLNATYTEAQLSYANHLPFLFHVIQTAKNSETVESAKRYVKTIEDHLENAKKKIEKDARESKVKLEKELRETENEMKKTDLEIAAEWAKAAVDTAGIVDPTPICDGVSAGLCVAEGDISGAGLSVLAMIPYLGDAVAKPIKGTRIAAKLFKLGKKFERQMKIAAEIQTRLARMQKNFQISSELVRRIAAKDFSVDPRTALATIASSRKRFSKTRVKSGGAGTSCKTKPPPKKNIKDPAFQRDWAKTQDRMHQARKEHAKNVAKSDGSNKMGYCSCPIRPQRGEELMRESGVGNWDEYLISKGCPKFIVANARTDKDCNRAAREKLAPNCKELMGHCFFFKN